MLYIWKKEMDANIYRIDFRHQRSEKSLDIKLSVKVYIWILYAI